MYRHSRASAVTIITWLTLAFSLQLVPLASQAADGVWVCESGSALQNPLQGGCATEQPAGACPEGTIWTCQNSVSVWNIFARVAGGLNFVTGALALFFIVLGGYRILSAAGNSEHFKKGQQMITYALLGLILTVGSYTILATTIRVLTGKQGPAPFTTGNILVDPLNLRGETRVAFFVLYGERILGFILSGLAGLSILMFVYGGVLWLTAAGNEERVTKAKKTLLYATLGIVVVMSSYIFTSFAYAPFYHLLLGD